MQDEMELHLARSTERLMKRGLDAKAARHAARREFGNVDLLQEQSRDARGARWIESVLADFRFGLRHFARTPFTTLTIIGLLALGIGLNSALFTLIYSMVVMPPPGIERAESLVRIRGLDHNRGAGRTLGREFSYPEYRDYAAQSNLFSAVAAWTSEDVVITAGENLQSGAATYVTPGYFEVMGVRPIRGAGLPVASSDEAAPNPVGVISHTLWDRYFSFASDVIGRTINVNDVAVTIVGVAPRGFLGARVGGSAMRVWLPLNARPLLQHTSAAALASHDSALLSLAARMRAGVEPAAALPTVQGIAARAAQQGTRRASNSAISTDIVELRSNNYYPPSGEKPNVFAQTSALMIPLIVLLIPCTSVSALLAGLAIRRRREIAVRLSLGAGRKRVIRQLINESVLVSLAAGTLGLFIIWALVQVLAARFPGIHLALHWPAIAFTFVIAIGSGVMFGLSPALNATRVDVAEVLKDAANAVASTRSRLQSKLVVAQIALTQPLLLLVGYLLLNMVNDMRQLPERTLDDRILLVSFNTDPRSAEDEQRRERTLESLQQRFAVVPGVIGAVSQSDDRGYARVYVHPQDRVQGIDYQESFGMHLQGAASGYFELMGYPFLRGRAFTDAERTTESALVIRSDLARALFGNADPIGRRLIQVTGSTAVTAFVIAGVVDERHAGGSGDGDPQVFVPNMNRVGSILVRTEGPAELVAPVIRAVANREAALLPVTSARTLQSIHDGERAVVNRVFAGALTGGALALLLCAIGLYAMVSFAVNQRTREIGIRTALGANEKQVVGMFFYSGLRLTGIGLLIGLTVSAVVVRIATLARGDAMDPRILVIALAVAAAVLIIATLATWVPARRAVQVDPLGMLRTE